MFYTQSQIYPVESDTQLLKRAILSEIKKEDFVLEIGTGNAEIASSITGKVRYVIATDINPHALHFAKVRGLEVVRADLTAPFKGPFSLIAFNLPYLPTSAHEKIDDWLEFALDGGPDGRKVFQRLLPDLARVLAPRGRFLLLISSYTGLNEVEAALRQEGYIPIIALKEKLPGEELYVIRGTFQEKSG